ncbi:MAG: hypothetical protein U5R31_08820 [Acidimicrobiia bacterium]|nr:hypothetical protein [Acidimicrobiia bacterium]
MQLIDAILRRLLGDDVGSAEVGEAAALAREAAETAAGHVAGRPLFAAHAALPWPDEPHLMLWQRADPPPGVPRRRPRRRPHCPRPQRV